MYEACVCKAATLMSIKARRDGGRVLKSLRLLTVE
jgi:hypothetical protein